MDCFDEDDDLGGLDRVDTATARAQLSQDTLPTLFPIASLSKYYYSVVYHW